MHWPQLLVCVWAHWNLDFPSQLQRPLALYQGPIFINVFSAEDERRQKLVSAHPQPKITLHGNLNTLAPKHVTLHFFKLVLGKGLNGAEVGGQNQIFSVLKHKPKVVVNDISCMILTTLLSIYHYTLFFQPNLYKLRSSKKSQFGRFYRVSQWHVSIYS